MASNLDIVRLLIGDKDKIKYPDDSDLTEFLTLYNDNIWLASAQALRAYVSTMEAESETIGSYSYKKSIASLLSLAEKYEKKAEDLGFHVDGSALGYDDYAEIALTDFNLSEIINNNIINDELN